MTIRMMRSFSQVLLVAGAFLISRPAFAQTKRASEIEAKLKARLDQPDGETTQGMVDAIDEAVKAYRAEVARVFEKLMKGLPPNEAKALADSHRAWLRYFDSMRNCVSYVYDAPGTIHRVEAMSDLKNILQHRLDEMCEMFLNLGVDEETADAEEVPDKKFWCEGPAHERLTSIDKDPLAPSPFEQQFLPANLPPRPSKK